MSTWSSWAGGCRVRRRHGTRRAICCHPNSAPRSCARSRSRRTALRLPRRAPSWSVLRRRSCKTVSFTRQADGWHVIFSCDLGEIEPVLRPGPLVGFDLGLKTFLVPSDGDSIAPPKFYRKAEKALRRAQRRVSRRQKGSKRRAKAVQTLARAHLHIANQRRDFHHKTARKLVTQYGTIAHEELNIKGIARSRLAKSTYDVGWGHFLTILHSKAEEAGSLVIPVPAKHTTQACSGCGELPEVPKMLKDRVHRCAWCGYEADRDLNAALNIKRLDPSRQALTSSGDGVV